MSRGLPSVPRPPAARAPSGPPVLFALLVAACAPSDALPAAGAAGAALELDPAEPPASATGDRRAFALEVPTKADLPVYRPRGELEEAGVKAALASLASLGEGRTVQLILQAAPRLMNVGDDEGGHVRAQLAKRYDELAADPLWEDVPSPLPSAFEKRAPLTLVAPPRDPAVDPATADVVVFLHGYGGNGKLFAWLVSRALPEAWVVAPSHGLTWARPRPGYLDESLTAFESKTGRRPDRYWLVGLSDGGVGSFEVLAQKGRRFQGAVNIVGVPRGTTVARLPRDMPMLWLNGKRDRFVGRSVVERRFRQVKARSPGARIEWFDAGHYFLLDDDQAALLRLRAFVHRGS